MQEKPGNQDLAKRYYITSGKTHPRVKLTQKRFGKISDVFRNGENGLKELNTSLHNFQMLGEFQDDSSI